MRSVFQKLVGLIVLSSVLSSCSGQNSRLQRLITSCLDTTGENYCAACPWPRTDSSCPTAGTCTASTEIWRENGNYIAIRDKKMCNCARPGFVHGLAIPRALIGGVESMNRPGGIWEFAWETAIKKGIHPADIALAINPNTDRSENQMHIHITRLLTGARNGFRKDYTSSVERLDQVWHASRENAARAGLVDYGVLVIQGPGSGYDVIIAEISPEHQYTRYRCND